MSDNDDFQTRGQAQPDQGRQRAESQNTDRQTQREQPAREESARRGSGMTLADLGRVNARPGFGGLSDAALASMIEAFNDNLKTFDKPVPEAINRKRFRVLPLDQNTARSSLSSLLVVLPTEVAGKMYTLVYVLLIEQPGGAALRPMNDRGENFDALILPEDALTDRYMGVIRDQVAPLQAGSTFVMVGHQVLLSSTVAAITDKEGQAVIGSIYDNALDAICGVRENLVDAATGKRNDEMRINPNMVARTDRLEVSFDYSGKPGKDTSGLPIRTDVLAQLFYSAAQPEEQDMYSRSLLGEVRAGLDLFLTDDGVDTSRPSFGSRRRGSRKEEDNEPFFQAVYNITSINSPPGVPYSLELAQLLIAQVALQTNDNRWANVLRPRATIGGNMKPAFQPSHLHLLNPDKELRAVVSDVSQNMSDADLYDFLDVTVKPNIAIGMSVPSSGEKSWVLGIFERIATSEPRLQAQLIKTLFESADVLTGNKFSAIYDELSNGTNPVPVTTTGTRVYIGTWTDPDGNVRDLREWNVPAVLTAVGAKNPELAMDFQWTFEDPRHSVDYSLAQRHDILSRFVPGLHEVGTCELLKFNPIYIQALSESLAEANMASLPTSSDGLQSARRVGNSGFSDYATSDIGRSRRRSNETEGRGGRRRDPQGGGWY